MGYTLPVKIYSPPKFGSIMFVNLRRVLATTCLALFVWTCCLDVVTAQVTDQRRANRRTFVEGLLRGLLESQLEQNQQPRQPGQRPAYPQPRVEPIPATRVPGRRPTPVANSGKIVTVRKALRDWSDQCDLLIDDLRQLELNTPAVRPLLADALQIRVDIDLLGRQAASSSHERYLAEDFKRVDREWRLLNYHLQSLPAASQQCRQRIDSCTKFDEQLCQVFGVGPQFDDHQVLQLASQLATNLNHLAQNLRYEVREQPACNNMIRQCQVLHSLIQQSPSVIRRKDYRAVTDMYKNGLGQWRTLSREICKYPSQRLRHDVQDIDTIGRQLQEQLYIPYQIDREYLAQLSTNVGVSSGNVFQQISLQDLLAMENPAGILLSAKAFQKQCDRFSGSIRGNTALEQLATEFAVFESNWNGMHTQCGTLTKPALKLELDEINYSMQTLHEAFGSQPLLDHGSMLRVAADLEHLSHELENLAASAPGNISRPTKNFHKRCYDLNERTLADRLYDPTPGKLNQMFNSWGQFKNGLVGYNGPNAASMNAYRRQIEPLMVKLQVVYQQ